jgi:pSer/pThr/pTyr-binding forkhead associated (FHA) protein
MPKEYKYKCRPCPPHIRRECIQAARISPGVKRIIERAFASHTDTQGTWDLLQRNCLLVLRDQKTSDREESRQRGLLGRMQRRAQERAITPERQPPVVTPPSPIEPDWQPDWGAELGATEADSPITSARAPVAGRKSRPLFPLDDISPRTPAHRTQEIAERQDTGGLGDEQPTAPRAPAVSPLGLRYPAVSRPQHVLTLPRGPRMLVAVSTGHRILLPQNGSLALGRFDPLTSVTPDVDLTFEDRASAGVSRRHCQISGWRGQYEIVDLGSSNGTWVNGLRLTLHEKQSLQIGDEIRLGACRFYFDQVPAIWGNPTPRSQFFLYVTFTGHYMPVPDKTVITIGRADPSLGYSQDIDLGVEGDIAAVVSRRHAKLTRRGNRFTVEDLGSAFKTHVDGEQVPVGIQVPIQPGQHLWLGGCVLAFDVIEK